MKWGGNLTAFCYLEGRTNDSMAEHFRLEEPPEPWNKHMLWILQELIKTSAP